MFSCRESEAKNLLAKRPQVSCNPEATVKETCTVMECFTPEGNKSCCATSSVIFATSEFSFSVLIPMPCA